MRKTTESHSTASEASRSASRSKANSFINSSGQNHSHSKNGSRTSSKKIQTSATSSPTSRSQVSRPTATIKQPKATDSLSNHDQRKPMPPQYQRGREAERLTTSSRSRRQTDNFIKESLAESRQSMVTTSSSASTVQMGARQRSAHAAAATMSQKSRSRPQTRQASTWPRTAPEST